MVLLLIYSVVYLSVCVCACEGEYVGACMYAFECVYICMNVYICIYIYIYISTYVFWLLTPAMFLEPSCALKTMLQTPASKVAAPLCFAV